MKWWKNLDGAMKVAVIAGIIVIVVVMGYFGVDAVQGE